MQDQFGRTIDYLRISITDRCNLRCTYCMPPEGTAGISHQEILRYEEIEIICRVMAEMGVRHVRITGGEPLVRKDAPKLVQMLKAVPGIETVTMTTNGILLEEYAASLAQAGVDGINISLDTLDTGEYARITRGGSLEKVLRGLTAVKKFPEITIKINCVLGENWEKTAVSLAEFSREMPVHVRFIEHMPIGLEAEKDVRLQDQVQAVLADRYGPAQEAGKPMGFGPGVYYSFDGFRGKIGFISAMSHKFCSRCNRVRLTADGKLRLCLQSGDALDLRELLRSGKYEALSPAISSAVYRKPGEHHFDSHEIETVSMAQIGG